MSSFYILIRGDEDGNPNIVFSDEEKLHDFLDDPEGYAGITTFENGAYLGSNPDASYWPDGVGVLLKCEVVIPEPAGKYVLR